MATTIPRSVTTRKVTASKEPLPEQEHRGHVFMAIYAMLVALATLGFAALAVFVRDEDVLTAFDAPIAQAIQSVHLPALSWILAHGGDFGWFPYNILAFALVFVPLFVLRLRLEAAVITVSTLVAGGLGTLAKDLVQRARPSAAFVHIAAYLHDYSFPSGHVIFYTTLFGLTFWVVWIAWKNSLLRNAVLVALALLITVVGFSRVYLGEHWPSDVLGAYCLASLWVAGTIELLLALKPRLGAWWSGRPHRRRWTTLL